MRGLGARGQSICHAPQTYPAMRHIPRACSQTRNTLPDMPPTHRCCLVYEKVLPKAQSPDGPENYGRLKQPLSGARPREGGSHAGVREGQTVRRVLRTSPTSRVARLTEAIVVRLETMARAVALRFCGRSSRIELPWEMEARVTQVSVCRSYAENGGRHWRADVLTASGLTS